MTEAVIVPDMKVIGADGVHVGTVVQTRQRRGPA